MYLKFLKKISFYLGIQDSPNLPNVLSNASWLWWDNVFRFPLGIVILGCLARYLGPYDFGNLNYVIAFMSLFSFIGSLGVNEILLQALVHDPNKKNQWLATALLLRLLGSGLVFFFSVALIIFIQPNNHLDQRMVAVLALGSLGSSFDVIDVYFQSELKSKYTILAKTTVFLLMTLVRFWLLFIKAPLMAFVWAISIEMLLGAAGLMVMYQYKCRQYILVLTGFSKTMAVDLLKRCWPMAMGGSIAMFNMRIDQVLLERWVGVKQVGIYAAAVKISELWCIPSTILIVSSMPAILRLRLSDEELYYSKLRQMYRLLWRMTMMAAVATSILAYPVIEVVYGLKYMESVPILMVYTFSVPFVCLGTATTYALAAQGGQHYQLFRTGLGCVVNLLLNCLLIPRYGGMGAAVAMVISCWVSVKGVLYLNFGNHRFKRALSW